MTRHEARLPGTADLRASSAILYAAAHPARLAVLIALRRLGPQPAGQLQDLTGLEQSALSHQLRTLREARLIASQRKGRLIIYSLVDNALIAPLEDLVVASRVRTTRPG